MDEKNQEIVLNSLGGLIESLSFGTPFNSTQLSKVDTLFKNNRWNMLSNMRQVISQLYVEHGIIQTLVDQPVQDAFREGYELITAQVSPDELKDLEKSNENDKTNDVIEQAFKWNRLYGGAGILIITGQDPTTPLETLSQGDSLSFRAVDMWELFYNKQNTQGEFTEDFTLNLESMDTMFNYYGKQIHSSRVIILKGKEAPSFIRPRLRGWGMSELERMVRSLNSYLKNQDLIFELLDEAKIDVYKMQGYNSQLATSAGTAQVSKRIQQANMLKNFQNAVTMDKEDEYEQKTLSFSGLGEIYTGLKQGVAADLKMPVTKLFGQSAAGFNAGDDDIENYNSMVEGEVRTKAKSPIVKIQKLKCESVFGFSPDDFDIKFPPLRILTAEQEENVKTQQANRVISLHASGLIETKEAKESINKNNLIDVPIEVTEDINVT